MKGLFPVLTMLGILLVFGFGTLQLNSKYNDAKQVKQEGNVTYVDGVYEDPSKIKVTIGEYRHLQEKEVEEGLVEQAKTLEPGVYYAKPILFIVPPKQATYEVVDVKPTKREIVVRVRKRAGEGSVLFGQIDISDTFPIGVYDEIGNFLH